MSAIWSLVASHQQSQQDATLVYSALTDARYDVWYISTALSHRTIKTALWEGDGKYDVMWEPNC